MYLQKSFDFKEVYKIMSFRDKMYLITFRHQCIWIICTSYNTDNILAPYFAI